jgi:hypothetical protein
MHLQDTTVYAYTHRCIYRIQQYMLTHTDASTGYNSTCLHTQLHLQDTTVHAYTHRCIYRIQQYIIRHTDSSRGYKSTCLHTQMHLQVTTDKCLHTQMHLQDTTVHAYTHRCIYRIQQYMLIHADASTGYNSTY